MITEVREISELRFNSQAEENYSSILIRDLRGTSKETDDIRVMVANVCTRPEFQVPR